MNERESYEGNRPPMSYYDGLYRDYATQMLRMCLYYLGNREQAEDCVQDVFVRLITSGVFITPGNEQKYLLKSSVNRCRDMWRNSWLKRTVLGSPALELIPAPNEIDDAEKKLDLMRSIGHLRVEYREVLLLFYYQNCTIEQIAEILSIPCGTVSSRLTRGREKLRQMLERK